MKKVVIAIIIVVVLIAIYAFSTYNTLITLGVTADTQWKQVETQYQRRFDLIPNLVETVKGVAKQEQTVFGDIAEARTRYSGATTADDRAKAASQVEGAIGRLLVIAENYPTLKSSDSFQTLMSQLEGAENRVSVERTRYNEYVRNYNLKVMRVPSSIIALIFGFDEKEYFNSEAGAEKAPKVDFE